MTKRMLIDSTHAEETRVVVLDGNRLEDYDIETAAKQQLKGNIYLAKIVRVEPSLQAAFVEFGGGRHGFLAFGEIHPDYYQIPVADRKRLLEMQEAEAREAEEQEEREVAQERNAERNAERDQERGQDQGRGRGGRRRLMDALHDASGNAGAKPRNEPESGANGEDGGQDVEANALPANALTAGESPEAAGETAPENGIALHDEPAAADALTEAGYASAADPELDTGFALPNPTQVAQAAAVSTDMIVAPDEAHALFADPAEPATDAEAAVAAPADTTMDPTPDGDSPGQPAGLVEVMDPESAEIPAPPEDVGGSEDADERPDRRTTPRFLRNYKIQEVMRRRQILLVQVVKEERGTKGAALTTYISLAGRFSVLMPNSPRGGGISRKITSAADRRRLKEITAELDLPRGMGLIVRTAGANRPKPEIIRDCEYLLNQWDQIRDLTMKSVSPALIYEEASLIKRAIRDVYSREVDDILVDGEAGWKAAHDFMRMLMPTHARKVQLWKDPQPLFAKAQVEAQLDAMLQPTVQLRSGGYLVINQTEALVAIDVNSGRSTRERGIEETALRTNMEAAEEAARQLRLRDLAGLIVIDFIDMESRRNNASVERKLKDSLKNDRARIQIGSISHFGLLEMSRQRLRPSLAETSLMPCPACGGTGHVRGTESAALHVLRGIEEEGSKRRAAEIVVHVAGSVALYILNHKRVRLVEIEERFGLHVTFAADDTLMSPDMRIERIRAQAASELPAPVSQLAPPEPFEDPDEEVVTEAGDVADEAVEAAEAADDTAEDADEAQEAGESTVGSDGKTKRRRRRRRGGRREEGDTPAPAGAEPNEAPDATFTDEAVSEPSLAEPGGPDPAVDADKPPSDDAERKRRGRRGGRRRRREPDAATDGVTDAPEDMAVEPPPPAIPAYSGPTPANPFGGANAFDFFDAVEEAEQARILPPTPPRAAAPEPVQAAVSAPEPVAMAPVSSAPDPVAEYAFTEEQTKAAPEMPAPDGAAAPDPVAEHAFAAAEDAPPPAEPTPAGPGVAPPIAPVLIGASDAAPGEKKRGWWRR